MGQLLLLPAGPRVEWAMDLITNLGPTAGPKLHVLTIICCFSKFCLLLPVKDKHSTTVAALLKERLFTIFGVP